MKLIAIATSSHQILKDQWFLPSLRNEYDVTIHDVEVSGRGNYLDADWSQAVEAKSRTLIQAIKENLGDCFVYSDVDVEFLGPTKHLILAALRGKDIVCQLDNPTGALCTGFFAIRANKRTLRLWEKVHEAVQIEHRDQPAFNRIIRTQHDLRFGALPPQFFGAGTFRRQRWQEGERIYIPHSPCLFHANWCIGTTGKIELLQQVKRVVSQGQRGILTNNLLYLAQCKQRHRFTPLRLSLKHRHTHTKPAKLPLRPTKVCLDVSTVCQLKCRTCPTAKGIIGRQLGSGFLPLSQFQAFTETHPWITEIEISNWGEIFLNPELPGILEHARKQNIILTAINGSNLNHVTDEMLDALVRYRLHSLKCSIDGASPETYSQYRLNGDFNRVMDNIRKINELKQRFASPYPKLTWQYVAFGHNEHEIAQARARAKELDMNFELKLSWDDLYGNSFSPVQNRALVRTESRFHVADRHEYEAQYGQSYIAPSCHQLWLKPRINFDGRLLGCSINHWGDYGNVFELGLEACLNGDTMLKAKAMLQGHSKDQADIPCVHCRVFHDRLEKRSFVNAADLFDPN